MGPIIIIEDDTDDQEIFKSILKEIDIESEALFFSNAETAFSYLIKPDVYPFIIFSDIKMPGMNGFQLRDKIHDDPILRLKCIPYIFLSTGTEGEDIRNVYSKNAQGFFTKPSSMDEWTALIEMIVDYWKKSKKP